MSDHNFRHSPDARLAVLEDIVRRLDVRLEQVSARTHTLTNTVQQVSLLSEEAREQRGELIEKVDNINQDIISLGKASMKTNLEMNFHVAQCDKRGARLEKIGLAVLAALLTLIGGLALWYITH